MDIKSNFNFEEWARLAREEPEKFEEKRRQAIEELLNNTPESVRNRMKGLQWQIDQYRETAKNPMASCIKISSMMWDTVLGEDGLVDNIERLQNPEKVPRNRPQNKAAVLEFRKNPPDEPHQSD